MTTEREFCGLMLVEVMKVVMKFVVAMVMVMWWY
jgi:hypothetical protein